MTTLPQTTSVRLPRPAGSSQLATAANGHGMPVLHAGAAAGAAGQMTGNDLWRALRANAWLIVIMLILSAGAGFGANYYLAAKYPKYTATGYLEVKAAFKRDIIHPDAEGTDATMLAVEQKTQRALLISDTLFNRVIQKEGSDIRKTDWYQNHRKRDASGKEYFDVESAKDDFADQFQVSVLPETRLLKVEFTSAKPKDCATIVREMCEQHIEDQRAQIFDEGRVLTQELNNYKKTYELELLQKENRLNTLRAQVSQSGGDATNRFGLKQYQMENVNRELGKADADLKQASGMFDQYKSMTAGGQEYPLVDQMVDANPQVSQQRAYLDSFEKNYEGLRDQLGEQHPRVVQAKAAYDRQKQKADETEAAARWKARASVSAQLEGAVASSTKSRDQLKTELESIQQDLAEIADRTIQYLKLEQEQKGITERLRAVDDQLKLLNAQNEEKINSKIAWRLQPEVPSNRSFPQLKYILPIAMGLGLALALGIAFLREVTDTTVRSPRDIQRVGQMQLLGMIGDESQDPQATGARLPLVIFDAPHSITAEQLRQVRTRLQHAASLDTTRSILVTSPSPGDGKTTIACNLAAGLALNGRRILLVDGNFRRPEVHKVFAVGNEQGFSDVLNGAVTFDEVVQETQVPNLAVMAAGPKPINATEMFESQLLIDFIERALEEFDHVIFDSGPMMVVSESAAMAPRVDGVVTVVRARGNSRGLLQRMRDSLRAVKAEHLGVVLNGVRAQGGGYYGRNIKTYYEYQNG